MPSSNRSCPSHSIFTTGHSLTQQRLQAMHGASNVGGLSVYRQTSNVADSVCLVWNIYITSTSHTYKMIHDGATTTANTTHGQIIHQSDNNLVALSLSARADRKPEWTLTTAFNIADRQDVHWTFYLSDYYKPLLRLLFYTSNAVFFKLTVTVTEK